LISSQVNALTNRTMSLSNFTSASLKSLTDLVAKKENIVAEIKKIEAEIQAFLTGKTVKAAGKIPVRRAKKKAVVKKAAPAKKALPAKAEVKPKSNKRVKRGGLKEKILAALEAAGDAGVKVVDLSKKLGVKGANLHIWFATTGKKLPGIKKVGKGHYKLVGK